MKALYSVQHQTKREREVKERIQEAKLAHDAVLDQWKGSRHGAKLRQAEASFQAVAQQNLGQLSQSRRTWQEFLKQWLDDVAHFAQDHRWSQKVVCIASNPEKNLVLAFRWKNNKDGWNDDPGKGKSDALVREAHQYYSAKSPQLYILKPVAENMMYQVNKLEVSPLWTFYDLTPAVQELRAKCFNFGPRVKHPVPEQPPVGASGSCAAAVHSEPQEKNVMAQIERLQIHLGRIELPQPQEQAGLPQHQEQAGLPQPQGQVGSPNNRCKWKWFKHHQ